MTPFDRSKNARIVAHMLALNRPMSAIEKALGSVAGGLEEADINRAILEGSEGRSIATLINTEHELTALDLLREVQGRGAIAYDILVHFKVRAGDEEEWRSATATAYGRIEPEDIRAAGEAVMAAYAAHKNTGVSLPDEATVNLVPNSIQYEFVVPRFAQQE